MWSWSKPNSHQAIPIVQEGAKLFENHRFGLLSTAHSAWPGARRGWASRDRQDRRVRAGNTKAPKVAGLNRDTHVRLDAILAWRSTAQLDKIASREAFACPALREVTTAGRAPQRRAKDNGVVLGDGTNLAPPSHGSRRCSFAGQRSAVTAARHEPDGSKSGSAPQRGRRPESPIIKIGLARQQTRPILVLA